MGPLIARSAGSFRVDIETGTHKFVADEPPNAGGTDAGPTPYDFLSSALAACTSMTMHFLAKRDNIPLEGVEISVTNDRMYAKDCADCTSQSGYIHRFDVLIKLRGKLTRTSPETPRRRPSLSGPEDADERDPHRRQARRLTHLRDHRFGQLDLLMRDQFESPGVERDRERRHVVFHPHAAIVERARDAQSQPSTCNSSKRATRFAAISDAIF